jgi:hypothetical protein
MLLISAALLGLPFFGTRADVVDWMPVGDEVVDAGALIPDPDSGESSEYIIPLLGGTYQDGDRIWDIEQGYNDWNLSFKAIAICPPEENVLNIYGTLHDEDGQELLDEDGYPIQCPLKIDGDVHIDVLTANAALNFKKSEAAKELGEVVPTIIEPYIWDYTGQYRGTEGYGYSMIVFNVDTGRTLSVNMEEDVTFRGRTVGRTPPFRGGKEVGDIYDLYIVFKGAGQVKWTLSDGSILSFTGDLDAENGITVNPDGTIEWDFFSNDRAGTKVFLCMDQTESAVDSGQNKVVFERKNFCDPNARTMVYVGYNSLITYLSDNYTGLADGGVEAGGCAALAFDPSNPLANGRLILFLKGAYEWGWDYNEGPGDENPDPDFYKILYKYPFNDAAVIVGGHFVPDFSDASIYRFEDGARISDIEYNVPAGIKAKFNIVDNKYYAEEVKPVAEDPATKRFLWVINDVQNHGTLAFDPYWYFYEDETDLNLVGPQWAWLNNTEKNVRHGFIIAINGVMDIYDNTGLAYVAGALNQVDPIAEWDLAGLEYLKKRNPSALIIDNVDESVFSNIDGTPIVEYAAGNPFLYGENARHAQIYFRGNGASYFMSSAASRLPVYNPVTDLYDTYMDVSFGYIFNFWARNPADPFNDDPIGDKQLNYDQALAVGETVAYNSVGLRVADVPYDGWQLEPNEMTQQYTDGNPMEGVHVFDAEGKVSTHGYANTSLYANPYVFPLTLRDYLIQGWVNGTFEMSSVLRDVTGREVKYAALLGRSIKRSNGVEYEYVTRPLMNGCEFSDPCDSCKTYNTDCPRYPRYNTPGFFTNDVVSLYDTILRHDDASKFVDGVPADSDPAYTGGEVYFFSNEQYGCEEYPYSPTRFRLPEMRFFNSSFELHESACVSGIRFVYRDIPGLPGVAGNNTSKIIFYDHGDVLDTLLKRFGRALQFSTMWNLMADGTSNYATESAFVNVYKGNMPVYRTSESVADTSSFPTLSLQRGDEYPALLGPDYSKQQAHHLFLLSQPDALCAHCYMYIGWPRMTTTDTLAGTDYASYPRFYSPDYPVMPFPYADSGYTVPNGITGVFPALPYDTRTISIQEPHKIFPLDAIHPNYPAHPGVVSVDGNLVTFGSWDKEGFSVPAPVTNDTRDGVIYVSHGGKLTSGLNGYADTERDRYKIPPQLFVDTLIAKLLWNDWDNEGWDRVMQSSGIVDLPADQVTFGKNYAVQPWGITDVMMNARADQTDGYVRVDSNQSQYTNNEAYNTRYHRADESGVEEMLFGWFDRDPLPELSVTKCPCGKQAKHIGKVKRVVPAPSAVRTRMIKEINAFLTRATESPTEPVARPAHLLYVGPEDDIKQVRVCGATMADPFHLDVTGDGYWPICARIREFTTQKTETDLYAEHVIGEGAHAVLFGEKGGTIHLGSCDWNEHSLNAWNLLGKDYVSIAPLGDMTVVLNSDLIVADRLPLIATTEFGKNEVNRITFYSELPREIRVRAGGELDLSAFGLSEYRQEIEFAGQVRLVLEDGAKIRFPSRNVSAGGVILYFNDESQFIFEGLDIPGVYDELAQTEYDTIKLIGKGDIWLNKDAKMFVNGDVRVGVESDELTPETSITLSIRRQAECFIGDDNVSGGIFQVGNPINRPAGHEVRFTLEMNGPQAMFQINREGFFGLAAGLMNKFEANPNGDADILKNPVIDPATGKAKIGEDGNPIFTPAANAWQVVPLYNVYRTSIEIKNGIFQHGNIYSGSDRNASLMVVGPAGIHRMKIAGADRAIIRGGGNLMMVPWLLEGMDWFSANIWDYAGRINHQISEVWVPGEGYSILGSAAITLNANIFNPSVTEPIENWEGGRSVTFDTSGVADWNEVAKAYFTYIGFNPCNLQQSKRVCLGYTQFVPVIGFINYDVLNRRYPTDTYRIVRLPDPGTIDGDPRESLNVGYLDARYDGAADPKIFTSVNS